MTSSHRATKHRISYITVGGGDQPIVDHLDALSVEGWEPFHLHEVEMNGQTKIMIVSRSMLVDAEPCREREKHGRA